MPWPSDLSVAGREKLDDADNPHRDAEGFGWLGTTCHQVPGVDGYPALVRYKDGVLELVCPICVTVRVRLVVGYGVTGLH